jgi:hypothetical protein
MIFGLLFELILVVGVSVLAHGVIAYVIAPKRAKKSILDAISYDQDFQSVLIRSLVAASSKPVTWKDEKGQDFVRSPIELLSSIISNKFQADFKSYLGGKQSEMIRDMESNAANSQQLMPDNPMLALAMSQIPKKYLPYVQLLANMLLQNQQQ